MAKDPAGAHEVPAGSATYSTVTKKDAEEGGIVEDQDFPQVTPSDPVDEEPVDVAQIVKERQEEERKEREEEEEEEKKKHGGEKKDDVKEKKDEAKEKAQESVEQGKEKIQQAVEQGKGKAQDVAKEASSKAEQLTDKAKSVAKETVDQADEAPGVSEVIKRVKCSTPTERGKFALGMGIAGFILSLILSTRGPRSLAGGAGVIGCLVAGWQFLAVKRQSSSQKDSSKPKTQ